MIDFNTLTDITHCPFDNYVLADETKFHCGTTVAFFNCSKCKSFSYKIYDNVDYNYFYIVKNDISFYLRPYRLTIKRRKTLFQNDEEFIYSTETVPNSLEEFFQLIENYQQTAIFI